MKSAKRRTPTLKVEVTNISEQGFWLLIEDRERFLSFEHFPWFLDVPIGKLINVQLESPDHLYWPELDADVAVDSIDHPDRYPLASRARPSKRFQQTRARARTSGKKKATHSRLRR